MVVVPVAQRLPLESRIDDEQLVLAESHFHCHYGLLEARHSGPMLQRLMDYNSDLN